MPIAALWPWLVGLLGSVVSSLASWLIGRVAVDRALHYALVTGFVIASAALFLAMVLAVKALIFGARVAMPGSLGQATYFLPGSISQIFATIATARVSAAVYRWTVSTMSQYLPGKGDHRMMGI